MNKTVYNKKTGKSATVPGVDAKEYVATGGWSYDDPKAPGNVETKKDGTPYTTEAAANAAATKAGYSDKTHEILQVDGGFIVSEKKSE